MVAHPPKSLNYNLCCRTEIQSLLTSSELRPVGVCCVLLWGCAHNTKKPLSAPDTVTFEMAHWVPSIKNAEDSSSESCSAESSEITRNNRTALNLSPSKPARSLQKKKYGDAFENDFRAWLGVLMKIHSRFIARPLNRFNLVFKFYRTAMNQFNAQDSTDSSLIEGAHCLIVHRTSCTQRIDNITG